MKGRTQHCDEVKEEPYPHKLVCLLCGFPSSCCLQRPPLTVNRTGSMATHNETGDLKGNDTGLGNIPDPKLTTDWLHHVSTTGRTRTHL